MHEAKRLLRLPVVMELVGIKRTVIYERIKAGAFPATVQIGPRAVAWDEEDLAQWQRNLPRRVKARVV